MTKPRRARPLGYAMAALEEHDEDKDDGEIFDEQYDEESDMENEEGEVEEDGKEFIHPLAFVVADVDERPMPFFLDSGSYYSIISEKCVKESGLTAERLEKPLGVLPITNHPLPISQYVVLNVAFAESVEVTLTFYVVKQCPVSLLIGRSLFFIDSQFDASVRWIKEFLDKDFDPTDFTSTNDEKLPKYLKVYIEYQCGNRLITLYGKSLACNNRNIATATAIRATWSHFYDKNGINENLKNWIKISSTNSW